MKLVYKDFVIGCDGTFTLYYKYLKEDEVEHKLLGYFSNFESVLRRIISISKDKELITYYNEYKEYKQKLNYISNIVYKPIKQLYSQIYGIRKV
jgi:hypothetical protein